MNDSKDVLLILQPQTYFISTLTTVSSIYNLLYVKDTETPPTAPPLLPTETLPTAPPLSSTEAPPTAPPPPVVDGEMRSTTDSEILISLNSKIILITINKYYKFQELGSVSCQDGVPYLFITVVHLITWLECNNNNEEFHFVSLPPSLSLPLSLSQFP